MTDDAGVAAVVENQIGAFNRVLMEAGVGPVVTRVR